MAGDSVSQIQIQKGRSTGITAAGDQTTVVHVDFPKPFSVVPTIVATFSTPSMNATYGQMTVSATNASASGFDIYVHNSGNEKSPSVSWIASG